MEEALRYLEAHREAYLDQLFAFLRIPSVSAQRDHDEDTRRAAAFIRDRMQDAGLEAGLFEGAGLPTVQGRYTAAGDDRPTLMVYGHYDVQPPEPLELWETPPFEPTLVDGEIRARGCADDKGPTLALLLAADCWLKATGSLPVNLEVAIEGEEESGGSVIEQYLEENREDLHADALVIADVAGVAPDKPALCYGLRGLVALEVTVTGPSRDLHSGTYGGAVVNPATALARMLASLHAADGSVAVEGFHAGIPPLDEAERARLAGLPFDEAAFLADTGAREIRGEEGYSTWERRTARPTCEINGIFGGYQGEGTKTIVPARAGCKITCRLVPGQDPGAVQEAVARHLEAHCPPGVGLEVARGAKAPAAYMDPETPWALKARAALESAFGAPAALTREGGSIPVVNAFRQTLGLEALLLGTYAPGEKAHSPNERYRVDDFYAAIRTGIHLFGG
ncbi:MAG: dipeptidase [Planctomycetota bacterium]|jgi:acetylornithine deacetylase/succinyl-diaminopimelate desuccinylase-like protein